MKVEFSKKLKKLLPCFEKYSSLEEYNSKNKEVTKDELLVMLKQKICTRGLPKLSLGFLLTSHQNFYTSFDGSTWYCGFLKIHSTYDNKIIDEMIGKGHTELEAVMKFINTLKIKKFED